VQAKSKNGSDELEDNSSEEENTSPQTNQGTDGV
jgi:hypothetical protein